MRAQQPARGLFVGALDKRQQRLIGRRGGSDGLVRQDELAQLAMIVGRVRAHGRFLEAGRFRDGVRVEDGLEHGPPPGQKPALITSCEYASRMKAGPSRGGAGLPEKRVTARSKLPRRNAPGCICRRTRTPTP